MFSTSNDTPAPEDDCHRDLIAAMNEANSFEALETLTRMAQARLNRRGNEPRVITATQRLRRALPFRRGS